MEVQQLLQIRKQKGYEIANKKRIVEQNGTWIVPSQTNSTKTYEVILGLAKSTCTCEDFIERGLRCKHQFAVEYIISRTLNKDGSVTVTKTKKITYSQNWKAYDKAQTNEKTLFQKMLFDVCQEIEEPVYEFGRPMMPIRDMIFSSALKVYSTFSLRRFMADHSIALEKGYVSNKCSYRVISKYMCKKDLTPILLNLITISASPLKAVETKFAIDSSGFRTTKFNEYCNEKHEINRRNEWIKAHICCGVQTNIITAVNITPSNDNDTLEFKPLSTQTLKDGFIIKEMSADKAYLSEMNLSHIARNGGTAFIPFKSNTVVPDENHRYVWRKMYNYFIYNREEFLQHYHLRSNVESTFFMLKSKFTDMVRSKNETAQINEILLKVLCHNICVLIQEMYEMIELEFREELGNKVLKL